jgi:hypothetical protein
MCEYHKSHYEDAYCATERRDSKLLCEATIARIDVSRQLNCRDPAHLLDLNQYFKVNKWHECAIIGLIVRKNPLFESQFTTLGEYMFAPDVALTVYTQYRNPCKASRRHPTPPTT